MSQKPQLTDRQQLVYDLIREKVQSDGYCPTVREIGQALDIKSPNGVMCHLRALEKKGLIQREKNRSRAIRLGDDAFVVREESGRGLPFVGQIAAGLLHEAIEQSEQMSLDGLFEGQGRRFILEVQGDSMIEAQIAEGDYVIVKEQKTAQPGQIVVAQTDEGEATLKYWFPEKGRVRLQPANSSMKPIYSKSAAVIGVVVGVVRKMP